MMTAVVIGKSEGQLDVEQFYSDDKPIEQTA
jgi:hypothetical protein